MDLSELFSRMLLVFFPGIIAMKIIDMLTDNQKKEISSFLLNSFVLGMISFFVRYVSVLLINLTPQYNYKLYFLTFLTDSKAPIVWIEIFWTTVTAILVGFVVTYIITHRIVYRIATWVKISKRFAEDDVWGYVFNNGTIRWVTVRDHDKKLIYDGWIEAFSAVHTENELFLRDVTVYNMDDIDEKYTIEGMYISRSQDNLTLEFRNIIER